MAAERNNQLFNINTVTEDYEFGSGFFQLKRTGILAQFSVVRTQTVVRGWWHKRKEIRQVRERVAVREFFPDSFHLAVRQKSRWVLGISLQGWKNLGWPPGYGSSTCFTGIVKPSSRTSSMPSATPLFCIGC